MAPVTADYLKHLENILQEDLYTSLVGKNPDSERISYLYEVVDYLCGSYTDEGVRIWFKRTRTQLQGNSPLDYLGSQWKPKDKKAQEVLELARSLVGEA